MILFKPLVWENVVLELNAKKLWANQIAEFLNLSNFIGGIKVIYCIQVHIY